MVRVLAGRMPRRCGVLLAMVTALVAAPPAGAFDSGPHGDITIDAMRAEGFGMPAAEVGQVDNYLVDFYSQASNNPFSGHSGQLIPIVGGASIFTLEHWPAAAVDAASLSHFDGANRGLDTTEGVVAEWGRLRRSTYRLVQSAKVTRDPLDLLAAIGMSLHEVQDFYSHSNWVETSEFRGVGPGWNPAIQGGTPTWFDVPASERGPSPVYVSATNQHRDHGSWQQDRNENLLHGLGKDWPGRPNYDKAYMTAYFASRQWVQAVRSWLGDEALWGAAKRYAQHLSELRYEVDRGVFAISQNAGRWYGEGGPCDPSLKTLSCGSGEGWGGTLRGLRTATKDYFEGRVPLGPTIFRKRFQTLIQRLDDAAPEVAEASVPVPPSRAMQAQTRFVRLKVNYIKGIDLGDIGPDDADMYARASISGRHYTSAVINSHDLFSFPKPYAPFTFIRPVTRGATYSQPITSITARIKTGDVRFGGTDDDVSLRLSPTLRFPLDKALYDDFERGDQDTYSVPIDAAARNGLSLADITQVQIEKSSDGPAGGWRLGGVSVRVNGKVLYENTAINRWLEDNHRTWRAPGLARDHRTYPPLSVWLDLRDQDANVYGGDDQGDINAFDARDALVRPYTPGTTVQGTAMGASTLGGRIGKGGDKAMLTYAIDTLDPVLGNPAQLQVQPLPVSPTPEPTPQPQPDLVFTDLSSSGFTVRNQGQAAAGPFSVTIAGFTPVALSGLAAGATATRAFGSGCYTQYHGTVDSLSQVQESDEANNVMDHTMFC